MMDPRGTTEKPEQSHLPLRWVVILAVGTGVGLLIGFAAGPAAGVTVGVATVGLLHRVVR
jgi:uncharacterized membrane protein YphA (DoxX/SURF4 family)